MTPHPPLHHFGSVFRLPFSVFRFLLVLFCIVSSPCLAAKDEAAYEVQFVGLSDKKVLTSLRSTSELVSLKNDPPPSLTALRHRADSDTPKFLNILHAYGYYDASVEIEILYNEIPSTVTIKITPGPTYLLTSFQILPTQGEEPSLIEQIKPKTLVSPLLNKPTLAQSVIDIEILVIKKLGSKGYPFASIVSRDVIADRTAKTIAVTLTVDSGPLARFGTTTIIGDKEVKQDFIKANIAWKKGEVFNPELIKKTQENLRTKGLFSFVTVTAAPQLDREGLLPVSIDVQERKFHRISAGIEYGSYYGLGVLGEWSDRNFRGRGEKLDLCAELTQKSYSFSTTYRKPHFLHPRQDLLTIFEVEREATKGYVEYAQKVAGLIERRLNPTWQISYGVEVEREHSTRSDNNRHYTLLGVPLNVRWNTANDVLDPTSGHTMQLSVSPYTNLIGPSVKFSAQQLTGAIYLPVTKNQKLVFAGWATFGSILGPSRINIPPPHRFYAGSEQSLRGYAYKTVGPVNAKNKPIGGRSIMIYVAEARIRATEQLGFALFYEMGNVYIDKLPNFEQKILSSVGTGLRYYSLVGPIAIDIAFPLVRRRGLDKAFQVYIRVGQAF